MKLPLSLRGIFATSRYAQQATSMRPVSEAHQCLLALVRPFNTFRELRKEGLEWFHTAAQATFCGVKSKLKLNLFLFQLCSGPILILGQRCVCHTM